jgi:hypothetical protein
VILLRHVLEHALNPIALLKQLKTKINSGGYLIIEVPNVYSGQSKFFGKWSQFWYVPYHTTHFTKENIKNLMDKLEFSRVVYGGQEMPILSNNLANIFNKPLNNIFRVLGMLLYPFQLLADFFTNSPTVITVIAKI